MAKQTFTTGQVLTAAQMTSLQQTAMLGGSASAKVASYTLVAADAGTTVSMSNASATTITVNTGLFAAGDTVTILNVGAGTCTITAGTATVSKPTNATLALVTSAGGVLYFTATGAATFLPFDVGTAGGAGGLTSLYTSAMSGLSTITTSTLAGTYKQLWIETTNARASVGNLYLRINGDTGSNYYRIGFQDSQYNAAPAWVNTAFQFCGQPQSATSDMYSLTQINNYAGSNAIKTGQNYGISANASTIGSSACYLGPFFWNNSAAITTITIYNSASTNWTAGTFTVWGLN